MNTLILRDPFATDTIAIPYQLEIPSLTLFFNDPMTMNALYATSVGLVNGTVTTGMLFASPLLLYCWLISKLVLWPTASITFSNEENASLEESDLIFINFYTSLGASFCVVLTPWFVIGATLEFFENLTSTVVYPSPSSQYPFARLASVSPYKSTTSYVYHQINDTTIGEDTYDTTAGFWTSANITVMTTG